MRISSSLIVSALVILTALCCCVPNTIAQTIATDNTPATPPVNDDVWEVKLGPTGTGAPGISTQADLQVYGPAGIHPGMGFTRNSTAHISVARPYAFSGVSIPPNTIWGLQQSLPFPNPLPQTPGETILSGVPLYYKFSETGNTAHFDPVFPRDGKDAFDAVLAADVHARDLIIANLHAEVAEVAQGVDPAYPVLGQRFGAIRFSTTPTHAPCDFPNDPDCPERGRDRERMTILNNGNVSIGMPPALQYYTVGGNPAQVMAPPIPLARLVVEGDPRVGMIIETLDDQATTALLGTPPAMSKSSFGGIGFASEPGYDFVVGKRTDYDAPTTSYKTFFELRRHDGIPLITTDISGQTGIGTNKPASILHVQAADNPTIRLQNSWFDRGGLFEFWTAATPPAADWRSVTLKSVVDYNDDDPKVLKEGRFTIATNGTQGGTGLVEALSCANGKVLVGDYNPSSKPDRKLLVNQGNVAIIPVPESAPMVSLLGDTHWNVYNSDSAGISKFVISVGNVGGDKSLKPLTPGHRLSKTDDYRIYDPQYSDYYDASVQRYLTIVKNGGVGINHNFPTAALHIRGTGTTGSSSAFNVMNSVGSPLMVVRDDGFVGIGTPSPHANDAYGVPYKLGVEGLIKAQEVRVSVLNWADFVFDDDYALLSLDSLSSFIKAENRLPEMPSALTAINQGIAVGEMHTKLVQKIEELTLYMIQLHEENQRLRERLDSLESTTK